MSILATDFFAEQRQRRSRSGRRERNLARIVLGVFDKIGHRVHWQRRIDQQHQRIARHQRDHREVLERVVGELLVERRVDRKRAARREQQRVAVRCGLRDGGRRGRGACARAVLDDEGFAQPLGELLRHQLADDVDRSAGGERHHDGYLSRRIVLRRNCARERQHCGSSNHGRSDDVQGGLPGPGLAALSATPGLRRCYINSDSEK